MAPPTDSRRLGVVGRAAAHARRARPPRTHGGDQPGRAQMRARSTRCGPSQELPGGPTLPPGIRPTRPPALPGAGPSWPRPAFWRPRASLMARSRSRSCSADPAASTTPRTPLRRGFLCPYRQWGKSPIGRLGRDRQPRWHRAGRASCAFPGVAGAWLEHLIPGAGRPNFRAKNSDQRKGFEPLSLRRAQLLQC